MQVGWWKVFSTLSLATLLMLRYMLYLPLPACPPTPRFVCPSVCLSGWLYFLFWYSLCPCCCCFVPLIMYAVRFFFKTEFTRWRSKLFVYKTMKYLCITKLVKSQRLTQCALYYTSESRQVPDICIQQILMTKSLKKKSSWRIFIHGNWRDVAFPKPLAILYPLICTTLYSDR